MSESPHPTAGEPARMLPPYRPLGPQPGVAPVSAPSQPSYAPVPSQSNPTPAPHWSDAAGAPPAPGRPLAVSAPPAPGAAYQTGAVQPEFGPKATFVPAQGRPGQPGAPLPPGADAGLPGAPGHVPGPPAPAQQAAPSGDPARTAPRAVRSGMGQDRDAGDVQIDAVLAEMVRLNASDVHFTSGAAPMVRIAGSLRPLEQFEPLSPEPLRRSLFAILTQKQREKFEAELELDLSYAVRGLARFRVNLYQQRESIGAAFRVIPYEIKPLEALGVPPIVGTFANMPRGLVLVTGPTGSGKSTTLAAIVDLANRTREDHIMTVEDPIEFLHRHKKSLINQREVGADTHSFANALKHVLRQDPDIILVGEMRDLETISVALTAAETGHLVFATLHTQDAAQTIDRVIDVFPSHQQAQVRTQLAGALQGVVCQTLCKRADAPGRAVATEVLVATPAIRNLIREGKTHQIYSAMQAGAQQGMHTMDQHLADLVKTGRISYDTGLEKCHHIEDFNRLTGRAGGSAGAGVANAGMGGGFYAEGGR